MKKLTLLLAIIGIVFSSCNGKYTIAKRKYNKGFYVSRNTGATTKPEAVAKNTVSKTKPQEVIQTEIVPKSETNTHSTVSSSTNDRSVKNMESKALVSKTSASKITSPLIASKAPISTPEKSFKKIEIGKNAEKVHKKGGSDSNLIVQVILSLFPIFCLIGVYLHDGKSITLNFWIDLLLHLTIYGCCIFALLVVLDIVNLA